MIEINNLGMLKNNAYIISNNKQAILIDAPPNPEIILNILNQNKLKLKYILITHGHVDHITSAKFLKEQTNAKIIANENDMKMFLKPWNLFFIKAEPFKPDILLNDKEEIKLGNKIFLSLKVMHTPGHTQGSICFYSEKENSVFSGDTLFYKAIGRSDLPGGDFNQLISSIKEKLFTLPDETKVFPGHGQSTTIRQEKKYFNNYI